ncbi:RING/FYVE/PHD zinc finger superfamily protein [Striga asiatica]|uniref:RING/FYVE/PHD zinc finger superfamily protein n=1 Tax=Striga asiatica TaxID=4170 RepID=A0A5A7RAR5_STRAF|nr:RING/FYVE/PHD zinc finger superfamily protein [Striga asiatica]
MSTLEITHIDLEIGRRSSGGGAAEEEEEEVESVCFSDGSSNSQFYSTIDGDGSYDDYSFACGSEILEGGALVSRKASSVADTCESVDLEYGEKKENLGDLERDCRICHLSLISSSPGSGVPIELGCSCKDDLAAAHKHCAEAWFKIKGNNYSCWFLDGKFLNAVKLTRMEDCSYLLGFYQWRQGKISGLVEFSPIEDLMAKDNAPSAFEKEQLLGMMEKEMEYRVDMFNKLTHTCFNKCVEHKYVLQNA